MSHFTVAGSSKVKTSTKNKRPVNTTSVPQKGRLLSKGKEQNSLLVKFCKSNPGEDIKCYKRDVLYVKIVSCRFLQEKNFS